MINELIQNFKGELDCNISSSLAENINDLNQISLDIEIIDEIEKHIKSEPKGILKEVIHDLISSLYSGLQGLYRNAYISLRSGIELTLAYVYFVDHNYEFLFWKKDKYDVKWSILESAEKGILSKEYLEIFSEDDFDMLVKECRRVYRHCSQFVHGKYEYMHTVKYESVKYNKDTFKTYLEMLKQLINIVIVLLLIRHGGPELKINEIYKSEVEEKLKKFELFNTLEKIKECWK